jgi:hypothetical protein
VQGAASPAPIDAIIQQQKTCFKGRRGKRGGLKHKKGGAGFISPARARDVDEVEEN